MVPETNQGFAHPEFTASKLNPMQRAILLRREVSLRAENLSTHPSLIIKEIRLKGAKTALKALEIHEKYSTNYAYVGDIHGLKDNDFRKLRKSLLSGEYDHVFFVGDIGGSEKLTKLQRLFYQGGMNQGDNMLVNKWRELQMHHADEPTILGELKEGFLNLRSYELELGGFGRISPEEAREKAEKLSDEEILSGIKWVAKHKHYGHYVSDLSDEVITTLATDVESYYQRFVQMVSEIRLNTKAEVHVIRGNWDARLPFDFEAETEEPVPLPPKKKRFNDIKFLRDMGVEYYPRTGLLETEDALHILIPFDNLISDFVANEVTKNQQKSVERARSQGKTIIMVAHAVPSWEMHPNKIPNEEGRVTESNLRKAVSFYKPDELVYGHEHDIVIVANGESMLDKKYRIITEGKETLISNSYESVADLEKVNGGVIASHVPIPGQDFAGIASLENPKLTRDKRPRGLGGKRSPVRVGKKPVALRNITHDLPDDTILVPGRNK